MRGRLQGASTLSIGVKAILGICFGSALLWLSLSKFDYGAAQRAVREANHWHLFFGLLAFWVGVGFRIIRWKILLNPIKRLSIGQMSLALIIGYALNIALPARIGELFRADFIGRRYGIARTSALGSIILERLLDAMAVLALFGVGVVIALKRPLGTSLLTIAILAPAIIALAAGAVCSIVFLERRSPLHNIPWAQARVARLTQGLAVIRGPAIWLSMVLSFFVWAAECSAWYMIVSAFTGNIVTFGALCLVVGTGALSTLLPSAPGYIGSLQVGFLVSFSALGFSQTNAVLSATACQILLFGSITLVGLGMMLGAHAFQIAICVWPRLRMSATPAPDWQPD